MSWNMTKPTREEIFEELDKAVVNDEDFTKMSVDDMAMDLNRYSPICDLGTFGAEDLVEDVKAWKKERGHD